MNGHPIRQTQPEIVKRLRARRRSPAQHHRNDRQAAAAPRRCPAIACAREGHCVSQEVADHDHIENCLEQAAGPLARVQRGPVDEFKAITKYL